MNIVAASRAAHEIRWKRVESVRLGLFTWARGSKKKVKNDFHKPCSGEQDVGFQGDWSKKPKLKPKPKPDGDLLQWNRVFDQHHQQTEIIFLTWFCGVSSETFNSVFVRISAAKKLKSRNLQLSVLKEKS